MPIIAAMLLGALAFPVLAAFGVTVAFPIALALGMLFLVGRRGLHVLMGVDEPAPVARPARRLEPRISTEREPCTHDF
jgi:hypothetical protein